MKKKVRLDKHLKLKLPHLSRNKIKGLILAGQIKVNGKKVHTAGTPVYPSEDKITMEDNSPPYVSRGGKKLAFIFKQKWLKGLLPPQPIAADIGSSTGGFTDCLLKHNFAKVYAIDVGKGQLDFSLRQDPRVKVMEKVNARYLDKLPQKVNLVTIDVSFISLRLILPKAKNWLKPRGQIIALFKPQFEVGKKIADRFQGVIKDPKIIADTLENFKIWLQKNKFSIKKSAPAPIKGAKKGNQEYLIHIIPSFSSI